MTKMIRLTTDTGNAYFALGAIREILPPAMHTTGTRIYTGSDARVCLVRETPDEVADLINAAAEEEARETEEAKAKEAADLETPDPKYPIFAYTSADRAERLCAATMMLNYNGGVLYDDGRHFVVADYDDYAEGRRVSGGELSENEVENALDWLADSDFDWSQPVDKTTLLDAAADAAGESDPWTDYAEGEE